MRRLQYVPDIDCDSDWYRNVKWIIIVPGIIIYLVIIPLLFLRSLNNNSHWIYHTARKEEFLYADKYLGQVEDEDLNEEEKEEARDKALKNVNDAKSAFGFFYLGLKVSTALRRPLK